ncbi:ABC transporter ATP-binding protein [Faecalispora anaeroviscerum]|uniref:ABC transporter ATP-binding protein n=1 Tax=Faecalispora anaeroviscerum TaxID=2991836 RepID=UPI0024B980D0|nr:ABC transporter ATP-binding protein [Faecalispora anaeroviscerum]
MLTVSNLTKRYDSLLANDDVNFEVQPGEIAVLMGPNGAGKSTTIKCIAGLLRFHGSILICGVPNKKEAARRVFGYVPELPALFPLLTVWEHIEFISRAYQLQNWQERAEALLDRMELTDKKEKLGQELSKGMQQKLSLCCALLPQPKVIMLDEPLVGLDPHAIKELKTILMELRDQGCAVLLSTHMLDSVAEFWDKALIMKSGKIMTIRTRTEIEQSGENLEQLFFSITENGDGGTAE